MKVLNTLVITAALILSGCSNQSQILNPGKFGALNCGKYATEWALIHTRVNKPVRLMAGQFNNRKVRDSILASGHRYSFWKGFLAPERGQVAVYRIPYAGLLKHYVAVKRLNNGSFLYYDSFRVTGTERVYKHLKFKAYETMMIE